MAKMDAMQLDRKFRKGHMYLVDHIAHGEGGAIVNALENYVGGSNSNKQSRQWARTLLWVENIHFGLGRHYLDDLLTSRIARDSSGNLSLNEVVRRRIPRPTNDILGRYIETNISILTENRPIPRIQPKSDSLEDKQEAELSELLIQFLWEELDMMEKHREGARHLMYTGIFFLENFYDPLVPRVISVPEEIEEQSTPLPSGLKVPLKRKVPKIDPATGALVYTSDVEYGDVVSNLVSGFELYMPSDHSWNRGDLPGGWIMKESYWPVDAFKEKYLNKNTRGIVNKENGYFRDNIEKVERSVVDNYPLWWWERLSDIVDGPNSGPAVGAPDQLEDYTSVKILDRKPNSEWPNGRTIIIAGNQLVYDSPKKIGARVYDKRWPNRWHPYVRYRSEAQIGSIYGRAPVTKALPCIKRINSIDTTMIMYRRTVPIACWIMPKGSSPVDNLHSGEPGTYITYDPNRTNRAAPTPVPPPDFPSEILNERQMMLAQLESIFGTEQILKGERPVGAYSAAAMNLLRQQALSSRSPMMQAWDESLQMTAIAFLQETKKHIQDDERYRQRLMLLAREKHSQFTIDKFAGTMVADNMNVKIDTMSMSLLSKEALQQRALEIVNYGPNLVQLPVPVQARLLEDLGWPELLTPQGDDVNRARMIIQFTKDKKFELAVPMPEDDPYVLHDMLVSEIKSPGALNYDAQIFQHLLGLVEYYRGEVQKIERAKLQMMMVQQGAVAGG